MKIILNDGTELDNLTLNGNNYIADYEVTDDTFNGKLKTVTIVDDDTTSTMSNCELVQITVVNEQYWFILREMSNSEIQQANADAQILYTAMMTDTLIESEG